MPNILCFVYIRMLLEWQLYSETVFIENAITFTKEFHFRKTFVDIIEININSRWFWGI